MGSLTPRATRFALVLPLACLIAHAFACDGPQPDDAACLAAGGVCVGASQVCNGTIPNPCAQGVCCVPGETSPAGNGDTSSSDMPTRDAGESTSDGGAE